METMMQLLQQQGFTHVNSGILQRYPEKQTGLSRIPTIVEEVLGSHGQPLDNATRTFMEPRFGHDFGRIRVHDDKKAAESAHAIGAKAYTVGTEIVFAANQYAPSSEKGVRLLAHELSHTVQQQKNGNGLDAEQMAEVTAKHVASGESIPEARTGGAPPGLYAQKDDENRVLRAPTIQPAFGLSWEALSQPNMFQLPQPRFTLTNPSLRSPSLMPPLPQLRPPSLLPPTGAQPGKNTQAPELPSRLPVLNRGRFSLGLRLGFPELGSREITGSSGSALQESLSRAEIMNQILTGSVPTGWEALDKAKLAKAVWGIFSTHIAPDLAQNITRGLSVPTGQGRTSFELDIVILTDFSGGGLSFTVRY